MTIPNMWGEGALFACSALDGTVSFSSPVGSLSGDRIGVRFHLKTLRELVLCIPAGTPFSTEAVTGDLILLTVNGEKCGFAFADGSLIVGQASEDLPIKLFAEGTVNEKQLPEGILQEADGEWVALVRKGERFALAFGTDENETLALGRKGLETDFDKLSGARLAFFEASPVPDRHPYAELAAKCLSVMKTQLYSPEGKFGRIWSTPNRFPHRRLWLWDSVFHAVGHRQLHPDVAEDLILAVFDTQREDGFIPHMSTPEKGSRVIQPPILAWGAWLVYEKSHNKAFLETVYEANRRFLSWCDENRRIDGSPLYTWQTQANERSRCDECGMDNSPRFDPITRLSAIDFSCYVANDMRCMAKIANALSRSATEWEERYASLANAVNEALYDEEDGFYYDYDHDGGRLLKVRSIASFLPLFAGICPPERGEALIRALTDPEDFGTPVPFPSLSKKDPAYGSDMWRGPVWINYGHMILSGLRDYGYEALADQLQERLLAELTRQMKDSGVLYEFYDPEGICPPHRQKRKGTPSPLYGLGSPMQAVRDFGWSCTLAFDLICEDKKRC